MTSKQPRHSLEVLVAASLSPWSEPTPPLFLTTPPQGLATPFTGCRTTCHHPFSAPANRLPMGSAPSARSAHPLPSLTFQWYNRNQKTPPPGHPAAPTGGLSRLPGSGLCCPPPACSPALCKQALCPALPASSQGLEVPMSPSPLPSLPTPPPSNMSLPASRPRPPWGYSSGPVPVFKDK